MDPDAALLPVPPGAVDGPARPTDAAALARRLHALGAAERSALLDRACGGDASLHAEVTALLALAEHPSMDLRAHGGDAYGDEASPRSEPTLDGFSADLVSGFRIVRRLGQGGAGVVYEAEQEQPRRRVALKVFRGRMASGLFQRRIAHEAEVLARLHHPGIAQVFAVHDGGTCRGEPPWIAMELVPGRPIDRWCAEARLGLRDRVALLARVAEAVAHAHASGVVHRDLKPSNVLVTDDGVAKVVDFGLAKTVGDAAAAGTLHTREGELVGTLAYMAAEQAQGASSLVDTRTDVHALGVMAFELLAGRLPRDPEGKALPEWAQELLRPAPSLRDVRPEVPLDLALVVGKALAGDRGQRYATAQAFADDLHAFLEGRPVRARAPTKGYLALSFVRRYRAWVLAAAVLLVSLTTGFLVTLRAWRNAAAQGARADAEAEAALREAYRARTSVAAEALTEGNALDARASLDRAPEAFRAWEWRYLDAQVERATRVVRFGAKLERWRCVSKDGARVAGGAPEGGAVVVDAVRGGILRRVEGAPGIDRGALLPDGTALLLARSDGSLERLELADGTSRTLVAAPAPGAPRRSECDTLCVSPSGRFVAESRRLDAPRLRVLDLQTLESAWYEAPDDWGWLASAFDAADEAFHAAVGHGRVLRWDLERGGMPAELGRHVGPTHALAVLPDGSAVLSGSADRRLMRLGTRSARRETLALHQQTVMAVAVSADARRVATWSAERVLRVLDAQDGRLLLSWQAPGVEAWADVRFVDGRDEVEVVDDSERRTWNVARESDLEVLRGHETLEDGNPFPFLYDVAFSPDGSTVATAGWDKTVRLWDVVTGRTVRVLEAPGEVQSVAWSPDGTRLATSGRPHHVALFDVATGERIALNEDGNGQMYGGIAFTPDGAHLLAPTRDDGPALRDARTLAPVRLLTKPTRWSWAVASSPHGVLLGYVDGSWELRAGGADGAARPLPPHQAGIREVAFSPDGTLAAAASEDGSASLVEVATGKRRALIVSHVGRVYAVAFSPDGRRLATGGDDATIRLHDTATGAEVLVLRGHTSYVHGLAFSPGGATLASASGDNTARLWSTSRLAEREAARRAALAAQAGKDAR